MRICVQQQRHRTTIAVQATFVLIYKKVLQNECQGVEI